MDESKFIFWIVFWLIVNTVIGYAIGKRKHDVTGSVILSILLGPIGWLIAAISTGVLRKCPFCSEGIVPDANVCRYCGRDLPELATKWPQAAAPSMGNAAFIWTLIIVAMTFAIIVAVAIWLRP